MNLRKPNPHISLAPAENVIQAVGHADRIGLPLNRHLTISWDHADCVGRIQDVQGKFLERFSKWAKYRGVPPTYVYALENGDVMGQHSHIPLHVPRKHLAGFKRMIPRWIDGDVDQTGTTKTFKVTSVRYCDGVGRLNPVKGILKYILSGIEAEAGALLGIEPRGKAGVIVGRRLGTSQNIGRKARETAASRRKAA